MTEPIATKPLAIVVKGYPRLSETFIAQELLGLQRRGIPFHIYSLRRPTDPTDHPIHREITAPVTYLPEYTHHHPVTVFRAWTKAHALPGYAAAAAACRADFARDRTRNRLRRFAQACVLATKCSPATPLIYAHFLHTPASVARYAAIMLHLPFAISAHAKDIWITPEWEKREKLAACAWLTTCTATGADHLRAIAPDPGRVHLNYHGLDLSRFPANSQTPSGRNGGDPADPVRILSVGRLVAKKGYDLLLQALAQQTGHWTFDHIGGGPLGTELRNQAEALGVAGRITWHGAQPQDHVLLALGTADIFVLASRIAADGDRDGLPNVLVEAQSQRLACLATDLAGIPELVDDGTNGTLVPAEDPAALATALTALIADPALRQRYADAGIARVHRDFAMDAGLDTLAGLLRGAAPRVAA